MNDLTKRDYSGFKHQAKVQLFRFQHRDNHVGANDRGVCPIIPSGSDPQCGEAHGRLRPSAICCHRLARPG